MTEKGLKARRSAEGGTGGAIAQYETGCPRGVLRVARWRYGWRVTCGSLRDAWPS